MDALQLDIFAELEKASDSRKANLCRSWKNAVLNDCGVFIENRVDIEVTKTKKTFYPRVTIHCAMEYPKVYYSFDICGLSAGGGGYPGHDSRNFDVHEHVSNVALMMEHELRARAKGKDITDKMINECVGKFKTAITSDSSEYTTECECCHKQIPSCEIFEYEGKEVCMDCWENKAFVDEDETDKNEGWCVCPTCKEKVGQLCKSGLCVECDFKKKHPDAKKKFCEQCIHFHYHNLYDENDHTECCCKLHMEGKNRGEWSYLCNDFIKRDTAKQFEEKYAELVKYASLKEKEKCPKCGKKWRFLYKGICGPCYEKNLKKADEIARGFKAEGYKEIPENELENAMYCLDGWIDERDMPAMEPRVGTRYFLIDVMNLTWRFFFKKEAT